MPENPKEFKYGEPKETFLPVLSADIAAGLSADATANPKLLEEYLDIIESKNPELFKAIFEFAMAKSEGDEKAQHGMVECMLRVCKYLDIQIESDTLNKEGNL